ncbi:MAG TPA: FAD-binding oxidoreductase [Solirubrobacteraceae bacterium]|nr:FAD-binding oxidoreductase [Solirubrobacteraceae bacterium]
MAARPESIAVVGAGIVGLSTAFALRRRGIEVRIYERGEIGGGQSAGGTRIFRLNHVDRRLVALASTARELWLGWEQEAGRELLGRSGVVVAGPTADHRLAGVLAAGGDAVRADSDAQRAVLPALAGLPQPAFIDCGGGPIWTNAALGWLAGSLRDVLTRSEVLALTRNASGATEVLTPHGVELHRSVIVAAGQDTARIAATSGVTVPVKQTLHARGTFALRDRRPEALAALQDSSGHHGHRVYGSPLPNGEHYAIGLSGDEGEVDPSANPVTEIRVARERLMEYVDRAMPGLDPDPIAWVNCWVTRLPWGSDAVACYTDGTNLFIAGNNLFKHAPALGELVAEAAQDDKFPAGLSDSRRLGSASTA